MDSNRIPKLFISHSSEDKLDLVLPMAEVLEQHGHACWIDQAKIPPGQSITGAISEGIGKSDAFVLVLSSSYFASAWCVREMDAIQAHVIT